MSNRIHRHYAPSATPTHKTHTISSTAPTYEPHCHPWICRDLIDDYFFSSCRENGMMELLVIWTNNNMNTGFKSKQYTHGGAVTLVMTHNCANCVGTPASSIEAPIYRFWASRWMADTDHHKSGRYRDKSRSDNSTHTRLDFRYLSQTNTWEEADIDMVQHD